MGQCLIIRRGGSLKYQVAKPLAATNFKAKITNTTTGELTLTWDISLDKDPYVNGVLLRYGDSEIIDESDGTALINTSVDRSELTNYKSYKFIVEVNKTYYFKLWLAHHAAGITRLSDPITLKYVAPETFITQLSFTGSGGYDWIVPAGWHKVDVFCVGGGAGAGVASNGSCLGGSGGGYTSELDNISVTPGQTIHVEIGHGGEVGKDGGASSFDDLVTANGGKAATNYKGGDGGSGGGAGGIESVVSDGRCSYQYSSSSLTPGKGGTNGSDGGEATYSNTDKIYTSSRAGKCQSSSTYAFGDSKQMEFSKGSAGISGGWYFGSSGGLMTVGAIDGVDGEANTGNAGSPGADGYTITGTNNITTVHGTGSKGGSGNVIIRRIS